MPRLPKLRTLCLVGYCTLFLFASRPAWAQWTPMNPVTGVQQQADGVVFTLGTGTLKLLVCSDSIIHVLYSATASFPEQKEYVITKSSWAGAPWTMRSTDEDITLTTAKLKIVVTRKDGAITYRDLDGKSLVQEDGGESGLRRIGHAHCGDRVCPC